ncbi:hypothetical protein QC763_610780 [Podospora pseudopauciseta]|uniref:Clr5 domain-containing protein n=1 Tax=Podospora pseudopauciseta TaxID=2093780 RepID=A0ABR0H6U5_9PEZI|nr:hypothetical protein QC763_610780 [Podospora pseudopauciseta]
MSFIQFQPPFPFPPSSYQHSYSYRHSRDWRRAGIVRSSPFRNHGRHGSAFLPPCLGGRFHAAAASMVANVGTPRPSSIYPSTIPSSTAIPYQEPFAAAPPENYMMQGNPTNTGAPPEKPLVPSSTADWEAKKDVIRQLYMDENRILNEVIDIMHRVHRFKATARMYKGQFHKWEWSKYNTRKGRSQNALMPAQSRATKKRAHDTDNTVSSETAAAHLDFDLPTVHSTGSQAVMARVGNAMNTPLLHQNSDFRNVEFSLDAYKALINIWSPGDKPWKSSIPSPPTAPAGTILQQVQQALALFDRGQNAGGIRILDSVNERIASALTITASSSSAACGDNKTGTEITTTTTATTATTASIPIEIIWDCFLAVPQLILTANRPELLSLFMDYLARYANITLSSGHPLTKISCHLAALTRAFSIHRQQKNDHPQTSQEEALSMLKMYVSESWTLWLDLITETRGPKDHVTIHLRRGYAVLMEEDGDSPGRGSSRLLTDFTSSLDESIQIRGEEATTARVLELEELLAKMYMPLFTPKKLAHAEKMLKDVIAKVVTRLGKGGTRADTEMGYNDRFLLFIVKHFLARIADHEGNLEAGRKWRRESLETEKKDLFWRQTSQMVEEGLRADGREEEAEEIKREMEEVMPEEE